MWIMWGNYCGLGWIIVDKSPGGFHKSRIGGKCGRIMCIKKSTLKIPQIKGFFENDVNKPSEKVDRFPVNKVGVFYRTLDFIGFFAIFT